MWLANYDPEEVYDFLEDEVDSATLRQAVRMANEWLYQKSSPNWNCGTNHPVEKAMAADNPDRYKMRRLAFVRHVLSSLAGRYPELVENLTEEP